MLVIPDQGTAGIGRKRGFASAGQAKENGGIIIAAIIDRTVHWHHAFGRQNVVQDGEHRLLGLAGIRGATDQDHFLGEVHSDDGVGHGAVPGRISAEARTVNDGELVREAFILFGGRNPQQVADEQ